MEKINFREKRGFSEVLNATFWFLRQDFSQIFKILMFTVAPIALITGIFFHYMVNFVIDMIQVSYNPEANVDQSAKSFAINLLLTFFSYFVALVMVAAVIFDYIKVYVESGAKIKIEIRDLGKWLKKDFWRLLLAALFLAFISFLVQIFVNIIPFIGMFIYMFVAVFVNAITAICFIIMVHERKGFFSAFSRTFDLLSEFWWVTFGIMAITTILQYSLAFSVSVPSMIAYGFYTYHSVKSMEEMIITNSPVLNIISAISSALSAVMFFLLQAITYTAMAFHYFNLVERKEGVGLLEEINKIGVVSTAEDE